MEPVIDQQPVPSEPEGHRLKLPSTRFTFQTEMPHKAFEMFVEFAKEEECQHIKPSVCRKRLAFDYEGECAEIRMYSKRDHPQYVVAFMLKQAKPDTLNRLWENALAYMYKKEGTVIQCVQAPSLYIGSSVKHITDGSMGTVRDECGSRFSIEWTSGSKRGSIDSELEKNIEICPTIKVGHRVIANETLSAFTVDSGAEVAIRKGTCGVVAKADDDLVDISWGRSFTMSLPRKDWSKVTILRKLDYSVQTDHECQLRAFVAALTAIIRAESGIVISSSKLCQDFLALRLPHPDHNDKKIGLDKGICLRKLLDVFDLQIKTGNLVLQSEDGMQVEVGPIGIAREFEGRHFEEFLELPNKEFAVLRSISDHKTKHSMHPVGVTADGHGIECENFQFSYRRWPVYRSFEEAPAVNVHGVSKKRIFTGAFVLTVSGIKAKDGRKDKMETHEVVTSTMLARFLRHGKQTTQYGIRRLRPGIDFRVYAGGWVDVAHILPHHLNGVDLSDIVKGSDNRFQIRTIGGKTQIRALEKQSFEIQKEAEFSLSSWLANFLRRGAVHRGVRIHPWCFISRLDVKFAAETDGMHMGDIGRLLESDTDRFQMASFEGTFCVRAVRKHSGRMLRAAAKAERSSASYWHVV